MSDSPKITEPVDATPETVVDDPGGEAAEHVATDTDDEIVLAWWQHPVNVIVMVLAAAIIAAAAGWSFGQSDEPGHNDVDTGFLQDMRWHHDQAVTMSRAYLDRPDTDPGLRTVAMSIIVGQSIENGRMVQLLRQINEAETPPTDMGMAWMGDPTPLDEMPGMASPADLDRLVHAEGDEADQLFAELMTAHHEGGIHMAEYESANGEWSTARDLADVMADSQQHEISEIAGLID